ncbi:MAG: gfo/Idh/MocA family oxidoreductase [Limimaricola sp.]|uniref:Gfo/Idh/MocA family protein n=1 Tax=Limimaricola sp. TaxID=2211665 RepID=UPI001D921B33|nr:Gfo/Idh/MocA family oxidoreductase [Limimaricola sp.]MBI1417275.1 gfo/Idh/MocA family oxidoreductase [Limimaricola sp.]
MSAPVRILIVGTGGMAKAHVEAYKAIDGVTVVAGVDTDAARLGVFNAEHGIPHAFASVEEALEWGQFDAASNVTPDPVHYPTTLPLLAAGKHVLCEKPLAVNHVDADAMVLAAAKAGVVNMVNLSYRNVPALMEATRMVAAGEIGEVRHFEAAYLQSWLTQPAWGHWDKESKWLWRLSKAHGSMGVLGDVGVHILDFATLVAGAGASRVSCRLTTFDKAPDGRIGEYVLDANDSMAMHLQLANGAVGVIHATRMATGHLNDLSLRIFGTKGGLEVRYENNVSRLLACLGDDVEKAVWHEVETPKIDSNHARFVAAIRTGTMVDPDFARGAALQRVLDTAVRSDAEGSADLAI